MAESIVKSSAEAVLNVANTKRLRILYVDDDLTFLPIAKQCLEMQGEIDVDTVSSVYGASEKLKKTNYDAIVCDYQMPGKDGLQFLKELREKGNSIPFIVFTGKGREEIAMKALNSGADGYFTKHGEPETAYGELAHGIGQVVDQRRAEQSFLKSEDKYRRLIETLREGIWAIDKDSRTTFVNPHMAEMLGYGMEEMKGRHLFSFMDERGVEIAKRLLERRRQGIKEQHDFEFLRKDGTRIDVTLETSPITDDNGNYIGALASVMDITERKKAEEEKSRLLHDLHARAKELNCLYNMSRLVEKPDISLDGILQGTADLLPPAMQYPDIACARIVVENREFSTKNFKDAIWKLQADIKFHGEKAGFVKVCYLEERPTIAEGPFLEEERRLIDAIAERLGKINERKRVERTLQEGEERFRAIFDGANDGILVADVKTRRFFFANPRICEITGYSLEELLKLGVGDIHPKKDLSYVIDSFTKLVQGKLTLSKDLPVLRKDGRVVYCDVSARSVKIGSQECLVGLFRDVTESKKADEKLKESEERFRAIFDGANDGILAADARTRIFSFANPRICEITGYSLEELLKLGVGDINPKKDLPYVIDSFEKQRQGKVALSKDIPVLRKDGRVVYCDVSSKSLKIGSQEYLVGFFRDVTESKKAEEKLRQNSDRIEMMNEKLRVVGGLTRHDVNNKLSAVTGYAYLLKKKHVDQADIVEGLGMMEQAVKEVGKIFDFARIYEKLGVEELTYVDVEKAVNEAEVLFSGLTIKVVNGCQGLTVLADSFLRQLFYNLIDNTRKYGVKATAARVYYEKTESGELRLVYEDDGVGISAENKLKLFTEGFSTGGSTGFGLFLIRKMMDVYSWQIQETGEPEKGAKFIITIPKTNLNGKENYQLS